MTASEQEHGYCQCCGASTEYIDEIVCIDCAQIEQIAMDLEPDP